MAKREHHVMLVLSDAEVAVLDEHRGSAPRATYLRRWLHGPSKEEDLASRAEAMAIVTRLARDGNSRRR